MLSTGTLRHCERPSQEPSTTPNGPLMAHGSWTLAGLLRRLTHGGSPKHALLVIDVASMTKLPALYRTLTLLPIAMNLLLVGALGQ